MKRRERIFFAQTLENSRVLIYLIFNEIQTSFSPCLRLFGAPCLSNVTFVCLPSYNRTTTAVLRFFSPSSRLRLRHCQLYFRPKNKGTTTSTCLPLAYD